MLNGCGIAMEKAIDKNCGGSQGSAQWFTDDFYSYFCRFIFKGDTKIFLRDTQNAIVKFTPGEKGGGKDDMK